MILIILVFGLLLRLFNIDQSLWLDEAISVLAARDFSYSGIIFDFLKIDNHPPVFYLLLKFWGGMVGFNDLYLRILPVLIGVGVIYFIERIAFKITRNLNLSSVAGIFAAASPLLIYYSQEVRMYILITLLATIQVFTLTEILKKESVLKWFLFSVLNCFLFFSDYITVFLFPVFIIYPLIKKDFKLFYKILLSLAPLSIAFIFWYPEFSNQLSKNKEIIASFPGWQAVIGGSTFKNLIVTWMKFIGGRISFEPKSIYYAFVLISSIPVLISLSFALRRIKKDLLLWLWLTLPILSGFLFSFLIPVFNYFRFIYTLPALLIILVIGIFEIKKNAFRILLVLFILASNGISLAIYYLDPLQARENWRQAADFIDRKGRSDDLVVFEFHEEFAPYRFYSKGKIDSIGGTDSYFADRRRTEEKLGRSLEDKSGVYYFEYLRDLTDPNRYVEQKLENEGFKKEKIYNEFNNIGQITYWSK